MPQLKHVISDKSLLGLLWSLLLSVLFFGLVVGLPGLRLPLLLGNATRLVAKTRPVFLWLILPRLRRAVRFCLCLLRICLTVAFLLTGTFLSTLCRELQAGMAQGRPWGYLWAYRSPNFWPSGGFHLLPWVGQRTFSPRRARGTLVTNAAALIWALHPGA